MIHEAIAQKSLEKTNQNRLKLAYLGKSKIRAEPSHRTLVLLNYIFFARVY
jgi:hypothetical protein